MPVNHGRSEKKDGSDSYQNFVKIHECFINVHEETSGSLLLIKILNGKLHFLSSVESSGIIYCFTKSETNWKQDTFITLEMGTPKLTVKL